MTNITGQSTMEKNFLVGAAVLIILYSICRLILELVFFIQQLHHYIATFHMCHNLCLCGFIQQLYHYVLDIATWVGVPLCICAIIFASVVGNQCHCPQEWQWQVGIAAVFLVWAHLIFYMRRMRLLGEYPFTECGN